MADETTYDYLIGSEFSGDEGVDQLEQLLADGQAARDAAQAAQSAAENAQIGAQSARDIAVSARDDAQAAETDAENAAISASADATAAEDALEEFKGVYLGALASDPTQDEFGSPVNEGDWYFNTTEKKVRIHNGSNFQNVGEKLGLITKEVGGTSYTITAEDDGYLIVFTAATEVTITLPEQTTESLAKAFEFGWQQMGAGQLSFVTQGSDALVNVAGETKSASQYASGHVWLETAGSPNTWVLNGRTGI